MNKYWTVFLICVPTYVSAVPNKPYDIIHSIVQYATDNDIVSYGTHNDALIITNASPALRAIYAGPHNSDFWSHYTVQQMGGIAKLADNCFINFQYDFYTEYRLFCGNVSDYQQENPTVTVHQPIDNTLSDNE